MPPRRLLCFLPSDGLRRRRDFRRRFAAFHAAEAPDGAAFERAARFAAASYAVDFAADASAMLPR